MAAASPPFGIVLPSRPVLLEPQTISPTQFAFVFPAAPSFSHIVIFLLPGTTLPEGTLAGVYIQLPESGSTFQFLGALGNEKQSAIFKVRSKVGANATDGLTEDTMVDESDPSTGGAIPTAASVTVGISVEAAASVTGQLQTLKASNPGISNTLVIAPRQATTPSPLSTKALAQRIIKNAFNFLASFAGSSGPGGQEVIPLKSFQDWWTKFERRVEADPGFLEREDS